MPTSTRRRSTRRPAWMDRPASPTAVAFARTLTTDRDVPAAWTARIEEVCTDGTAGDVSAMIDALKALPYKPSAKAEPGYYQRGEDVFVVVQNRAATSTYAKQMVVTETASGAARGRWGYAPGVGRTLADLTPLTVVEAARLGRLHGVCMICGAALTDPESVARGIGPVCAAKVG